MTKPLELVASQFIRNYGINVPEESIKRCEDSLIGYINGEIDYQNCHSVLIDHIKSDDPLVQIKAILSVGNSPLPSYSSNAIKFTRNGRKIVKSWSKIEDNRLLFAIHKFGLNNWQKIAEFVGNNRSKTQCSQRWFRVLDPRIKKGPWTEEEESLLIHLVQRYGLKSWKQIAEHMEQRTDTQCRYHYNLLPENRKVQFKSEEQESPSEEQPLTPLPESLTNLNPSVISQFLDIQFPQNSEFFDFETSFTV
ncbi:Myb-like DNA-binding domain containing protein [Trichomonas vaginalis G3]|uniref:Myb-like DNA-binding domain containing protein n=1 Tax=Trichomonas vaginalis (strain ATCC PRA-98 / G3) TaxID=412133 RepID=A2DHV6_TRIV3|nr:RNA polymerase II transcription regulator recruiting protein [Trichomonas vaginalis G3]EAY19945.1 Myb-like DNA-binding domain containing protein [Trichomonas vaginalis G3]KAI5525895.1 RNA polymerase II transcription regulator recruiting protein [Trichomonas vaginalis G3]|eukprot:XP_001580931.1 Myb-like DNA-binding domain containing protein [Trichomonas vaginalis G3]